MEVGEQKLGSIQKYTEVPVVILYFFSFFPFSHE